MAVETRSVRLGSQVQNVRRNYFQTAQRNAQPYAGYYTTLCKMVIVDSSMPVHVQTLSPVRPLKATGTCLGRSEQFNSATGL